MWLHGRRMALRVSPMKPTPTDGHVSIDELREAVEHLHGVPARFVEPIEVDERFND
jgi:hypothetical protein